ncbi:outer membrane usher protein FimD [Acinetobacter guillouiae]|uniref:outer membrane usher protein FimD n=1 Tax=Acinetobacter guillouiae TaxID=106649 RepID=UPI003AF9FC7B
MATLYIRQPDALNVRSNVKKLSFCVAIAMGLFTFTSEEAYADQTFNTAFLKDGLSDAQISDLSKFENSNYQVPGIYRVEVYSNNEFVTTRDINFVEKIDADGATKLMPCLDMKMLDRMGVNLASYPLLESSKDQHCIDFSEIIEGASADFQFNKQKLYISIPQAALENQIRGYIPPEQWDNGINGLFINYNLSGYKNSRNNSESMFVGLDNGFNLGSWQFRHSSSFNYNSSDGQNEKDWNNLYTYVRKNIIPLKSELILGDGNSEGDIFDGFNFRGAQLSSSSSMYPDSQQGYAPVIRGIAKTNAKVVVKQSGFTVYQLNVAPGPFVIEDLGSMTISGDLQVFIEENDGTVQTYTIPYSSLPIFQREGRTKYNITAGEYRSGLQSKDDPFVFQATLAHGLKKGISIYSGTQLSENYQSFLMGLGSNLGNYGALSFDVTHAESELIDGSKHSGQSLRFLYSKSLLSSGTTFQLLGYRYSTRGFYTLDDVTYNRMSGYNYSESLDGNHTEMPIITDYYDLRNPKKGRFEVSISHSFGEYGSIYLSGNQQTYWGTSDKDEWIQAGYSGSWNGLNYGFSANQSTLTGINQKNTTFTANLSFPLDKVLPKAGQVESPFNNAYSTISTTQNSNGNDAYLAGISGTLLKDRNLSYSLNQGYVNDEGNTGSLNVNYKGGYGTIGGGYSYERDSDQVTVNASGSILAHRDGITFGQPISGTAILVKAPGAKGVNIENQTGVKTDWRGYAILPYASEYRMNRVALDGNSFANNLEITNNVANIVPIKGAIARATFKTSVGLRALVTISHNDKFVPFASNVIEAESSAQGVVAEDGRVYLTSLPTKGVLTVKWGDTPEESCVANYDVTDMDLTQPLLQFDLKCD